MILLMYSADKIKKNSHANKPSTTATEAVQDTLTTAPSPESESITTLSQQAELVKR